MKGYTNLIQSRKLAKILSVESADMYYAYDIPYAIPYKNGIGTEEPCWSLAALIEQLPVIEGDKPLISLTPNGECDMSYIHAITLGCLYVHASNLLDACYEMILKLKEKDLL